MWETILKAIISYVVPVILGYLIGVVRKYKMRDKTQEEALKCLLRSNITSKYYIYNEMGFLPKYEKENINYMAEIYNEMKGNSYISRIVKELNDLPVK